MLATLTGTDGAVAVAAGAVALVALACCGVLGLSVRRLRRTQRMVLGDRGEQDVVSHVVAVQEAFEALHEYVEETAVRLDERLAGIERAMLGRIAHRALVRYDAYNELSGQQSMSIALLDDQRSGIVLSCIHHRDQARVYGKQVVAGKGEIELSPEEAEAVRQALASPQPQGDGAESGA